MSRTGEAVILEDVIRPGTTRGLDFVIVSELVKRTGIMPGSIIKFAMAEMLCNSLDKDAAEIDIRLQSDGVFYSLEISDNGSKNLLLKDVKLILDFDNKASSKRGLLRVSRGYLGNALKCIFGYSYALAESEGLDPPDIMISSGGREYSIQLQPDSIAGIIKSHITTAKRTDDGWTKFLVKFPWEKAGPDISILKDVIFATSMVNPGRKTSYNLLGEEASFGETGEADIMDNKTSVLWYTEKQFSELAQDFVRGRPETQLKEFIPLFRGFTSKKLIGEILQELNGALNHDYNGKEDVQFFPATRLHDLPATKQSVLFQTMRRMAKPISKRSVPSALGVVGKESFEKIRADYGWERLKYTMAKGVRTECPEYWHDDEDQPCMNPNHVSFPYIIELALFDRKDEDTEGLKVYQCVNFMASMEDIFSRIFSIPSRLGRVGISEDMPVTVVAHLVCPVLKWLNYGKSGLDD